MSTKPKLTTGEEANRFIEKVREKYLSKGDVFPLQDKTVTENGEVKADENYYGLNKVTVNVLPIMEPITVISSGTEQTINPPSGTTGFSKITVNPIDLEDKTITENGVYTNETKSGFGEVTVNVKEDINLTYKQKVEILPKDFAILENFTKVPDYCFYYDINLHYIELPDSVTEIGYGAFYECSNLININLPSVATIGGTAFYRCNGLVNIDLSLVTSIGNRAFSNCSNLTSIELPLVTDIKDEAFRECGSLKTIELPAATTIGSNAFLRSALKNVTLGSNLTSISYSAFSYCSSLTEINIYAPKSQVTTASVAPWGATNATVNWLGGE